MISFAQFQLNFKKTHKCKFNSKLNSEPYNYLYQMAEKPYTSEATHTYRARVREYLPHPLRGVPYHCHLKSLQVTFDNYLMVFCIFLIASIVQFRPYLCHITLCCVTERGSGLELPSSIQLIFNQFCFPQNVFK